MQASSLTLLCDYKWKRRSGRRKHCALALLQYNCSKTETKIFALPQTPFPGARDGQNLISWSLEMVTAFTYEPSLVRIDARNFELSW